MGRAITSVLQRAFRCRIGSLFGVVVAAVLIGGGGAPRGAEAQSISVDTQQVRPPALEQIRQRIRDIHRTPTQWRRPLDVRPSASATPTTSPELRGRRSSQIDRPRQTLPGLSQADLERVERRLQALIRQYLSNQYGSEVPAGRVADRFVFQPSAPARVGRPSPDPDTVRIGESRSDSVRMARDTVRQTRIERVERQLLDTGVFRAFEVNFAFNESTLQPRAARTLDAVGAVLRRYPDLRIEISGHTDAVGGDAFNQELSEARAAAVRAYLVDQFGIASDRLLARGYGEAEPVASNQERAGRALNRRVEFQVLNPEAARSLQRGTEP